MCEYFSVFFQHTESFLVGDEMFYVEVDLYLYLYCQSFMSLHLRQLLDSLSIICRKQLKNRLQIYDIIWLRYMKKKCNI